jgi:molecular chaperone Hsp33
MSENTPHSRDRTQRFLFEEADIRGEIAQIDSSYREILAIHQYAPGVSRLLGEFMAAAVLLATTLKFEGKLVLQVRSEATANCDCVPSPGVLRKPPQIALTNC